MVCRISISCLRDDLFRKFWKVIYFAKYKKVRGSLSYVMLIAARGREADCCFVYHLLLTLGFLVLILMKHLW
jgi:hypothetical protein